MKINVRIERTTYTVEIEDLDQRPVLARIGDETFEVWPEEESPHPPSPRPGPAAGQPGSRSMEVRTVISPLPGTVIEVKTRPGAAVQVGQALCVIESMKMKNTIRASRDGTVAAVHIQPGQSVAHHAPLLDFTE